MRRHPTLRPRRPAPGRPRGRLPCFVPAAALALLVLSGCGAEPAAQSVPAGRGPQEGARTIPAALRAESLTPVPAVGEVLPIVLVDRRARRLVVLGEDRTAPVEGLGGGPRVPAGAVLDLAGREGLTFEETVARLERLQAEGELACEVMEVENDARGRSGGRYGDDDPVLR